MTRAAARFVGMIVAVAAFLLLAVSHQPLQAASPEAQVKAAYLVKIASFVRWPASAGGGDFRICVSGRSDIAGVVAQLARSQQVDGKPLVLASLGQADAARARSCQILFVGRGGQAARSLIAAAESAPVLVVTDRNNGTRGGAIEFLLRDGKVRFAIDRGDAEARGLELSSKLLEVAVAVER